MKRLLYILLLAAGAVTAYIFPLPDLIILNILMLLAGFFVLIQGAELFVDGSCSLAEKLGIPSLIAGLTIVAMGTSAPELAVSVSAALSGSGDLAVSNAIGSDMFNLMMALGLCSAIKPILTNDSVARRDYPISIAAVLLFAVFILDGFLSRAEALILVICLIAYIAVSVLSAKKNGVVKEEAKASPFSAKKCAMSLLWGAAGIFLGGELVVDNAKAVALKTGMSETLAGLTVCALGTSLPELVTAVAAAKRGENDMAVGNVIGSNIFNILAILGISGLIAPMAADAAALTDSFILIAVSLVSYIWYRTDRKMSRAEGVTLVSLYFVYMAFIVIRNYV